MEQVEKVGWTEGPLQVCDGAMDRSEGDPAPRWEVVVPNKQTTAYCRKEADARLYAAAPDLYEALAAMVAFHGDDEAPGEDWKHIRNARAALTHATAV